MTATHLSESGRTLIEARLTWVRLNAELKNWRKVGRESLAFLQKDKTEQNNVKTGGRGGWALNTDHNHAVGTLKVVRGRWEQIKDWSRKAGTTRRTRWYEGQDKLQKSDRKFAADQQETDREKRKRKALGRVKKTDAGCDIQSSITSSTHHDTPKLAFITVTT